MFFIRSEMDGVPAEVFHRRGLYDVTLSRIIHDRTLRQETIFECVLSIPLTPYQITRSLIYYPGLFASGAALGSFSSFSSPLVPNHVARSLSLSLSLV